jgi:ribokinase
MSSILLMGRLLMDSYIRVREFPARGQDAVIYDAFDRVGGCTFNAAATIKNLGGDPYILSPICHDEKGSRIMAGLRDRGFKQDLIFPVDGATTYCLVVLDEEGERTFLTYTGSQDDLTVEQIKTALLLKPDYVHLSGYSLIEPHNAQLILFLLERLKQGGAKLFFDPGPLCKEIEPSTLKRMLHLADVFCPNAAELQAMDEHLGRAGVDTSPAYLAQNRLVVVKDGQNGVTCYHAGERLTVPAYRVNSVDGTGAGDSFAGGLIYALSQNYELERALQMASACGALTAAVLGPQADFSVLDVEKIIR